MRKKLFLIIFSILFLTSFNKAEAVIPVTDVPHTIQGTVTAGSTVLTVVATSGTFAERLASVALNIINSAVIVLAKLVAAYAEQTLVKAIVGDEDTIIRDFGDYLYNNPNQKALVQMNLFFNNSSQGRGSSLNYEGVGPNYDAYLIAQAKSSIVGQPFVTNIQSQVVDPTTGMFSGGNMKGVMSFFQCSNNPYCYTLAATNQYQSEYSKAQEIAKAENTGGFKPTKKNGRITNPAAIAQNALLEVDQMGTKLSMDATNHGNAEETPAALAQIAEGTAISTVARLTNYGIVDPLKKSIDKTLAKLPFSLSYSETDGWAVDSSLGGVNLSTGAAYFNGSVQIGNACATLNAGTNGSGQTAVIIDGVSRPCPTSH